MFDNKALNPKFETVVGPGTELEGNIRTTESLRIDGKIKGEIHAESVVIGEHGVVLGDIIGTRVTIAGKVKGNVAASQVLELLPTGHVLGDFAKVDQPWLLDLLDAVADAAPMLAADKPEDFMTRVALLTQETR